MGKGGFTVVLNVMLRFLLEVLALVAIGFWGFQKGSGMITSFLLGIGVPLIIAIIWGVFFAPASTVNIPIWLKFGFEVVIFGLAFVALVSMRFSSSAYIFGLAVLINQTLLYVFKQ
ncbi:conserved domain protein [Oceanobacillus picturae]|uniref:Conserved domain protein n=1 Tax=Oceanobacillus picturae TaxID=171693 RepID=A0A0U9H6Y0_9BACI|nr:conserved domain protein [Oceanobacillus picturae]